MTTKRATLPGADELFRTTTFPKPQESEPQPPRPTPAEQLQSPQTVSPQPLQPNPSPSPAGSAPKITKTPSRFIDKSSKLQVPKEGSGRQRHEEKITFYCTRDELLALERARLALREYGVNADRGRIVREAISYVLADLDANGQAAVLADRLSRRR